MKKIVTLLLALTMALSLAACGDKNAPDSSEDGKFSKHLGSAATELGGAAYEDPQISSETTAFEPTPLGDFSAQDFEGNTITKDIFADYDLTMVNLWTTTCGYCIEEMPVLNELREELQSDGKSFNIISICMDIGNTDEINEVNFKKAEEIIEKTGVSYPNLIPDSVLLEGRLKGVQAFPESFFVDSDGNVVSAPYVGAYSKNHWKVMMNDEIQKNSQSADKE